MTKVTILLEIDLEKDVPNLLAHIESRASTISGVRMAEGKVLNATFGDIVQGLIDAYTLKRIRSYLEQQ